MYNKKTDRTYLSIVESYQTPDKKIRSKTIKSLGYLDTLEKEYSDPIAHFTVLAKEMTIKKNSEQKLTFEIDVNAELEKNATYRKNFGHLVASKIYHELEIHDFLNNAKRNEPFKFNSEAIMRLLVYSRLLYPSSKRSAFSRKDAFIDKFNFSLDDIYHCLDHFDEITDKLQAHLHNKVTACYGRNTDLVYYDVTNYYFEIDQNDTDTFQTDSDGHFLLDVNSEPIVIQSGLRKKGASKENKKAPIVQMGLFMDDKGLPMSYKLFEGNTHDSQTMIPMMTKLKKEFGVKKLIAVADKGLNSGDNIAYNTVMKDGYIFSKSIRGASEEFKQWVLKDENWVELDNDRKFKSQVILNSKVHVTVDVDNKGKNKKKTIEVPQKFIVGYSKKYAQRSAKKREEAINKAKAMINKPAAYKRITDYGAAGYVKNLDYDEKTGEIKENKKVLLLDEKKIKAEAQFDGYYALVTSEIKMPDKQVIEAYKGLWRIEESFKITKSTLHARPIYHSLNKRINAHFLICFICLLIGRIIEMKLENKYSVDRIIKTLGKVECSLVEKNIWLFNHRDDITEDLNKHFNINFGRKYMTMGQMKQDFANSKKVSVEPY
jgi:transposase